MSVRALGRLMYRRPSNNFANVANFSAFKSSISLDKLYPASTLNPARTPEVPQNDGSTFSGFIPMEKIQISYSKSSGPGGMNVNKLNTKVDIRFKLETADWIPEEVRTIMKVKYRNQLSKDGCVILTSDRTRSQHYNLADALEKLREFIREAEPVKVAELSPETLERIRRRREKAARERLQVKRGRASLKSSRGSASSSDL